jgi:3-phenylpropionate/trans-cinnamate dioxygenase ferredoxin reductase subunit
MSSTVPGMVIVGAGEAGVRAALTLRGHGWTDSITLIGAEAVPPYERPPLSKAVMIAEGEPDSSIILTQAHLDDSRITFLHDRHVSGIDRAAKRVEMGDGEILPYHKLLIATGAQPRKLAVEGAEDALYLRTFADALALRAKLRPGSALVIIGGGFIGLELAASAIARGCRVTVLEAGPRILMRGVPQALAERIAARHKAAGVDLRVGVGIARIRRSGGGLAIDFADGTEIACDAVIAGVGAQPVTALAESCGLEIENGIRADETLRTSDHDIFAAGDCCSFPAPLYGGQRLRLEAWRNAQAQGELAAANMLGAGAIYDAVPWFWSDQYEQVLQVAGLTTAGSNLVRRAGEGGAEIYFHLAEDGRLVAASGMGPMAIAKDIRIAETLIARRARPEPEALANPKIKLRALLVD